MEKLKVTELMKDQLGGNIMTKFVGLNIFLNMANVLHVLHNRKNYPL